MSKKLDFSKFNSFWRKPDEVRYVPYLVYSQLDDWEYNENREVTNDIKNLSNELVACWQFDTACFGDIDNIGTNNGNYLEITTVRVYDNGKDYNVLVTSKIISDFYSGSEVELWEKSVSKKRIFEILTDLKKTQRKLYSSH